MVTISDSVSSTGWQQLVTAKEKVLATVKKDYPRLSSDDLKEVNKFVDNAKIDIDGNGLISDNEITTLTTIVENNLSHVTKVENLLTARHSWLGILSPSLKVDTAKFLLEKEISIYNTETAVKDLYEIMPATPEVADAKKRFPIIKSYVEGYDRTHTTFYQLRNLALVTINKLRTSNTGKEFTINEKTYTANEILEAFYRSNVEIKFTELNAGSKEDIKNVMQFYHTLQNIFNVSLKGHKFLEKNQPLEAEGNEKVALITRDTLKIIETLIKP